MLEFELARTLEVIAREINEIKEETVGAVISGTIEIGKRLCEAKEMCAVGSWGQWLRENVDYSERTAQNMMAIYNEYGKKGVPEGLKKASLTNAIAMLGLPEDVKHELLESGAPESMSTRELKEEIARLREEKEKAQQSLFALMEAQEEQKAEADDFERVRREYEKKISEMNIRLSEVTASEGAARDAAMKAQEKAVRLDEARQEDENARKGLMAKIRELEDELDKAKKAPMEPAVVERVPEEIERELQELRAKMKKSTSGESTVLFRDAYSRLIETFKRCAELASEVAHFEGEPQAARLRSALAKAARQMADKLEA